MFYYLFSSFNGKVIYLEAFSKSSSWQMVARILIFSLFVQEAANSFVTSSYLVSLGETPCNLRGHSVRG